MTDKPTGVDSPAKPGHRAATRIFATEAYRRIMTGKAPQTLSELAAQLSAWFKETYPEAPLPPISFVEAAIRDSWHRRHEAIGSEL